MNNTVQISSDKINVYTTLEVKANPIGKSILFVGILIILAVIMLVISTIEKEEIAGAIVPIILCISLLIFFPIRYLIWNFCGKETLIVNTKSISYNYNYGILQTNLKTIPYDKLGLGFEFVREYDGIEKGKLVFYNYREQDNLPEIIHQTSILADKTDIDRIESEIANLFFNEIDVNIGHFSYSEN